MIKNDKKPFLTIHDYDYYPTAESVAQFYGISPFFIESGHIIDWGFIPKQPTQLLVYWKRDTDLPKGVYIVNNETRLNEFLED